ncbi:MAG: cupin [Ignavibacteriae bacterium HGW-Ignavibacteriae-2]|jgi:mannose-6-phosphate isomerase-like protein (cupin superfamily)|nr:MAG: cupin [Ignavibacteriae bacterium HGW-Ignavibacteriae-2]
MEEEMNAKYIKQINPFMVPVKDNKIIYEHFGSASINEGDYSIAFMTAPAGWSEPYQVGDFDEVTLVLDGKKLIEIDEEKIELIKNQSILVKKGTRVRYSNPFDKECSYVSFCIPAFTIDRVKRE